ncbi:galactose-binding lectin l-1-like [Anguilla anguilla]|uniref:galactose-binding lectin l-1-like n=1 Tax=Anguilla anguilla TaxID=7936 RepID=UPI0015AD4310|nr:galactose-binding lectin l-1-like [Anguilla anguilla]
MSYMEVKNINFSTGMELKVKGVVKPNPVRFSINVGLTEDKIALHFDPRFNYHGDIRTIILDTKKDGSWQEQQKEKDFPFEAEQEFEVTIVFNLDTFDIYLSSGKMVQFPNRLGLNKYKHIFFVGDATIQEIIVKPSGKATKK